LLDTIKSQLGQADGDRLQMSVGHLFLVVGDLVDARAAVRDK